MNWALDGGGFIDRGVVYERGGDGGRLVPKRSEYCKIRFFWGGGRRGKGLGGG